MKRAGLILRDPVHDLVTFESEEELVVPKLLAAREVQRLRRIRQLGVTHFVFPGAEHSRFTHAIGAAHVMTKMIARLRQLGDDLPFWQRLASDRARDALCAALLHDVGHGPFSHLFEQVFDNSIHHELWSVAIILDSSTDVHKMLSSIEAGLPERVASLVCVTQKPYELPYLARAMSGTFDVDRCDYLLRDAHMTGVRYGLFDLSWLLRSVRFEPCDADTVPHFAIDGMKGLPAIEGFALGRRFMFEQVYLHKASRAAEFALKAILHRAQRLLIDGHKLPWVPPAIGKAALGVKPSLGDYLALDDIALQGAIAMWECNANDAILSDLCARFRNRVLPKTIDITRESPEGANALMERAKECARAAGFDPEFYVARDVAIDVQYYGEQSELSVISSSGKRHLLTEVSPVLAQLDGVPIRKERILLPEQMRQSLV